MLGEAIGFSSMLCILLLHVLQLLLVGVYIIFGQFLWVIISISVDWGDLWEPVPYRQIASFATRMVFACSCIAAELLNIM